MFSLMGNFARKTAIFKSLCGYAFSTSIVIGGLVAGSGGALSNIPNPADLLSVNTRVNPDYDPVGVSIADFRINAAIDTDISYQDNIYATKAGKVDNIVYAVRPSIYAESDWVRHSLLMDASFTRGIYRNNDSENYTDYKAGVKGRIDLSGQTSIPLEVTFEKNHIGRDSADDRAGNEPSVYELWAGTTGIVHNGASVAIKLLTTIRDYTFNRVESASGNFINDDRDRQEYTTHASIGMHEDARIAPFVYAGFTNILYDNSIDRNGEERDSKSYETGAGGIINFSDVTKASFNLGHINRDIDDRSLRDISDYTYSINVRWEPSTLLSFTLAGKRTLEESVLAGASAYVLSTMDLSAKYELFSNVFVDPSVSYSFLDYKGINKELERFTAGLETTYKMNRNLWLLGRYKYVHQNDLSIANSPDNFSSNTYNLSLKVQF